VTNLDQRARAFAALGDTSRLAIVESLLAGDASPSELSRVLAIPGNLLAHHLDVLQQAGVVVRRRSSGDGRRSYVHVVRDAIPSVAHLAVPPPSRIVFVCTHNSARSVIAEALWARESPIPVASAGTDPARDFHPRTLALANRCGLALPGVKPQHIHDVITPEDFVISVCDQVFEEMPTRPTLHWSVADPFDSDAGFTATYGDILTRINALVEHFQEGSIHE
jgi:ArsR family transcriptional regulator, arsenate/arsenite/antimonite-responsive transcriptional repressor / arsenate reductase (thioredoxin)